MSAGFLNPAAGPGANMPADPAGELMVRQKLAKLLAGQKSYSDSSPKQHPLQVLAQIADGAMAGLDEKQQIAAQMASNGAVAGLGLPPGAPDAVAASAGASAPTTARPSAASTATPGAQISGSLSLDENNIDLATRTAMAEAGSMGAPGMRDVAAVLRNRALLSGKSVADEALAKNQFEPWNPGSKNDPRRFKNDSPEYKAARAAIEPVLMGSEPDPTGGATHFYAPKAQSALGRNAPKWDDGSGEDRGLHRFFRHPWAGKDPRQLAKAPEAAAGSTASIDPELVRRGAEIPLPDGTTAPLTPSPGSEEVNPDPGAPKPVAEADTLRSQLQAAFDAKRTGQGGPDTAFTSFLTGPKDPNGGYYIPPEVRATARPGDPSGPRPGDEPVDPMAGPGNPSDLRGQITQAMTAQKQRETADLATSFRPEGMGAPAGGLQAPAEPPAPPALAPMNVPQPPARPDEAALAVSAPAPAAPAAAAAAPAAPQPRVRPQIASVLASQPAAAPATPAAAPLAPQGSPARDNIAKVLMGGAQDGLDRIFGGAETQARLDAQQGLRGRIAEAVTDKPAPRPALQAPKPTAFSSLPAGGAAPVPAAPQAADTASQSGLAGPSTQGPQTPALAQVAQAPRPAAAPTATDAQPAQSGNLPPQQEAWLQKYMQMKTAGYDVKAYEGAAAELIKQKYEPRVVQIDRDGRRLNKRANGEESVAYDTNNDGTKHGTFAGKDGNTYAWDPTDPTKAPTRLGPSAAIRIWGQPGPDGKMVSAPAGTAAGAPGYYEADGTPKLLTGSGVSVTTNVDTKGAGKFAEVANTKQADRYSKMMESADEAVSLKGDIDTLADLGSKISTNRLGEAKLGIAQYAKAAGLDDVAERLTGGKLSEMEAYQAITEKLAPRMRVPGSGATSDYEMRGFKNSLPTLLKTPEGNAIAVDTFRSLYDHQMAVGEIAGQAIRGEISQKDADAQIRSLESPFARFKEHRKAGASGDAKAGDPAPAASAARDGGAPAPVMTPGQSKTINGVQIRRVN